MNYLKTIFITTIVLNIYIIVGQDIVTEQQQPVLEEFASTENTTEQDSNDEKKTELQKWNDHVSALTKIQGEYWDTANNIPTNDWKENAFIFAQDLINKDKSSAETIKLDFLNAINAKIKQEDGKFTLNTVDLIKEFNDTINAKVVPTIATEEKEEIISEQPISEVIIPEETQQEPLIDPTMANSKEAVDTELKIENNEIPTSEQSFENLKQEWLDLLDKFAREGTDEETTNKLLKKIYELAEKLPSSYSKEGQEKFDYALKVRGLQKKLYPVNINDAMEKLQRTFAGEQVFNNQQDNRLFESESQQAYDRQFTKTQQELLATQQELQKKSDELAAREAQAEIEREKEAEKTKQKEMLLQAALTQAQQKGRIEQHTLQEFQTKLEQKFTQKEAEERAKTIALKAELKKAREELAKNMQEITATQKSQATKGILATMAETVSGWWYGQNNTQQQAQLLLDKQNQLINTMANTQQNQKDQQAIKDAWLKLQNMLLTITLEKVWNVAAAEPQITWIYAIQNTLKTLITTYSIIPIKEACDIINNALQASNIVDSAQRALIITAIKKPFEERELAILAKKKEEQNIEQRKIDRKNERQQRKEQKEQEIRELEKIKRDAERKKQDAINVVTTYKNEKNQWKDFLAQIGQNKYATKEDNKKYTHEALNKSQSLLNLATIIPSKNQHNILQKLKQKFTLALLDQQKTNEPQLNIHQNMDQFNNKINKILE
ncbi:MAG TPA: hypothetical protein VLB80_01350 [Candidatus Babeliales bacterium]|nr:hypothetical protein [Candidatus Babeliales bacterium]